MQFLASKSILDTRCSIVLQDQQPYLKNQHIKYPVQKAEKSLYKKLPQNQPVPATENQYKTI